MNQGSFPVKPEFCCSFYCEDHVHFHMFIGTSKYVSFHISIHMISTIGYITNSQWPALQLA